MKYLNHLFYWNLVMYKKWSLQSVGLEEKQ